MFVYALARGARMGYLPAGYLGVARAGYAGIVRELITVDSPGLVTLDRVCAVAGLGGSPYRDGSYAYYVGERVAANDYKGVGPFILASLEIEGA
jgi:unsaturated rhamnogalacturonyl hydrolase